MAGHTHSETARIPDDARGWDATQVDARLSVLPWANGYRCVENYEIHAYVDAGGMGSVFRAHHRALRRDYALKFPKLSTPDARARFEREARAGARPSCDHLIHVVHLGRVGTLDFLVMEWVEGGSLRDLIKNLPEGESLPLEETLRILRGVARALQVLHADGVYHRDVKPANVMYSTKGVVKLADYGLISSEDSQDLTAVGVWAGSPQYAAPEQKRGLSFAKAPADVYSLGATAFFVLTGVPPEEASTSTVPDVRPALAGVPVEIADFVCRCMLLEPAQRYSDGGAAVAALDDLQRRLAAGALATDGEAGGRRRRAVVLAAVGLVCTAAAAVWWGGDPGTPVKAPAEASRVDVPVSPPEGPRPDAEKPTGALEGRAPLDPEPATKPDDQVAPAPLVQAVVPDSIVIQPPAGRPQAVITNDGRSTEIVLEKIEYGTTTSLSLDVGVSPACEDLRVVRGGSVVPATFDAQAKQWRVDLTELAIESTELQVTPIRAGESGGSHRVHIQVPCLSPDRPPLRRERREVAKPVVRYRLHLDVPNAPAEGTVDLDHLFIAVRPDLLCAETELMRGQFQQFLDDGDAFERGLAAYPDYTLMLAALKIESGVRGRRGFFASNRTASDSDLPVAGLLPHEAAAFADWLTERGGLLGLRCRLPRTEELRGIGNLNADRVWSAQGLPPLPADATANVGPDSVVVGAANQPVPPGPPPAPESVWARRQGRLGLYHLGGNLAELTIDEARTGGGPSSGHCLGGSYAAPAREMALGLVWNFLPTSAGRPMQKTNLGMPSLGCRLVVVPLSPNK